MKVITSILSLLVASVATADVWTSGGTFTGTGKNTASGILFNQMVLDNADTNYTSASTTPINFEYGNAQNTYFANFTKDFTFDTEVNIYNAATESGDKHASFYSSIGAIVTFNGTINFYKTETSGKPRLAFYGTSSKHINVVLNKAPSIAYLQGSTTNNPEIWLEYTNLTINTDIGATAITKTYGGKTYTDPSKLPYTHFCKGTNVIVNNSTVNIATVALRSCGADNSWGSITANKSDVIIGTLQSQYITSGFQAREGTFSLIYGDALTAETIKITDFAYLGGERTDNGDGTFSYKRPSIDIILKDFDLGDQLLVKNDNLLTFKNYKGELTTRIMYEGKEYTMQEAVDLGFVEVGKTADGFNSYTMVIPEPSTYAMIFGALALGFVAYRRRK